MVTRKGSSRCDETDETTDLGRYLISVRVLRKQRLTQQQVADKIQKSRSFICRIERGNRRKKCLQGYVLYDLAKAYEVPIEKVLKKAKWPQLLLVDVNQKEKKQMARYIKKNL